MAFEKHYGSAKPADAPACIHLRSKAIYVTGELKRPDHPDEAGSQYCWCNLTQHVLGPDRGNVDQVQCSPGRECFRETH